jgi:large conductance mechanosensitive channel
MFKEFKNFIMTGNVIDFAVGVILAGAVGSVVNGFVSDIAMPIVGKLAGGVDFKDALKFVLTPAEIAADGTEIKPEVAIKLGSWITSIINLIMTGLVLFFIVKSYNKVRKPVEAEGPSEIDLLKEIRDSLKK